MAVEAPHLGTGRTGGREATTGVIPGKYALSVGRPDLPAPKGWKWTELKSVAQLESGHTPSRRHPEYWDGEIPWIGIKDAVGNHGTTIYDTFQHVTQLGLDNSSARLLPANTVCLSRTASVGYVCVMGKPMATSQDFVNWVCGPEIDAHFLKYVLVLENEALWRFASGTTHQTIYYPEAKAFHVCLPPIAEQKRIAHILCSLDDKIELNRQMNAALEAMARAIFQSWFVDFDPVHRNAEGGTQSPDDYLFPDSFEHAEQGAIPSGWLKTNFGQEIEFSTGFAFKSASFSAPGDIRLARGDNVKEGFFHWDSKTRYWPEVTPELERYRLQIGDVLIGMDGSKVGKNWVRVRTCDLPCLLVQRVACLRARKSIGQHFVWLTVSDPRFRAHVDAVKTGSSIPHISGGQIKEYDFVRPPIGDNRIFERFEEIAAPLGERIDANIEQIRTLELLRDTLLPKLLKGEIIV